MTTTARATGRAATRRRPGRARRLRTGISTRWYDATAAAPVAARRTASRPRAGQSGVLAVEHQEHRVVVEVETVGDPPDVPEGPERQRPRQPGSRSHHHRQDHRRGGSGHQQEPPVVEEGPLAAHGMERPQQGDGSDGPEESDDPARRADATGTAGGAAPAGLGALPDPASVFPSEVPGPVPGDAHPTGDTGDGHGQQGAGHDLLDPGVGAVVEAGDAHSVVQEQGGHRGREDDPEGRHHGQAPAPPPAQHEQGEGRPDQVELLLDRQRPGVEERGGWPEPDEVVLPGEDEPPVRHVGQRGEGVTP